MKKSILSALLVVGSLAVSAGAYALNRDPVAYAFKNDAKVPTVKIAAESSYNPTIIVEPTVVKVFSSKPRAKNWKCSDWRNLEQGPTNVQVRPCEWQ